MKGEERVFLTRVKIKSKRNFMMITTTKELTDLCRRLKKKDFIAVDTEFIREKTYYAVLCLIQVASEDEAWLIDPLSEQLNLDPLLKLLCSKKILKVFHAARQDIEIFYDLMGKVPTPVFDTQVGAMVCGLGESVSYQMLVADFLKINLDKSSRFTDWRHRPLSEKQEQYALSDVTYLVSVYQKMKERLEQTGRDKWVQEEMNRLVDPALYRVVPKEMWRRIKRHSDNPRFLAILREVAAWREEKAIMLNKPRKHVLKDEAILEIAATCPQSIEELAQLRSMNSGLIKSFGQDFLNAVQKGKDCPENACPRVEKRKNFPQGRKNIVDILRLLLNLVAEREKVAAKIIATTEDLERMAESNKADVPAMKGWRYVLFGRDAMSFKQGNMAVRFNSKTREIEFFDYRN